MCSHHHQSVFTLPPSVWYAEIAAPKRKLSGNRGESVIWRSLSPPFADNRPAALHPITEVPTTRVVLSRASIAGIATTFLLMGMIVAGYGPLLEHLIRRFGVSLPVAGATISVHFAGSLPGVLIAMRSFRVLPARVTVMIATAVVSLGLVGVALAFAWSFFLVAVFVIGLGFGALVLGVNQLVAYSEGRRRAALLNALNGAYSAGAVAGPIMIAAFAEEHFSLLYLAAAGVALALTPGAIGISGRLPVAAGSPGRPGLLVVIFILAFTLYVAVENGTGGLMTSPRASLRPAS